MDLKIILFLICVILLCTIGEGMLPVFATIGRMAGIFLIIFLGYVIFKKIFLK
jgi:hypothetical protein